MYQYSHAPKVYIIPSWNPLLILLLLFVALLSAHYFTGLRDSEDWFSAE